ncbi:MAG: hypothetical protein AAF533_22160 [Acidobacteriota bacterium]
MDSRAFSQVVGTTVTTIVLGLMVQPARAVTHDFNDFVGSDAGGGTPLDGQGGWTAESFNTPGELGVTETLGFDGTPALRFIFGGANVGADASLLNDAALAIPDFLGSETDAYLQADLTLGFWGNRLALAHDRNGNGRSRSYEVGEIGPSIEIGGNPAIGVGLRDADGVRTMVPLATLTDSGGEWLRLRLLMDVTANGGQGVGSLYFQDLERGDPDLQLVPGLENIDLRLDPGADDARNPQHWDGLWLHHEGHTNETDNIVVERFLVPSPIPLPSWLRVALAALLAVLAVGMLRRS